MFQWPQAGVCKLRHWRCDTVHVVSWSKCSHGRHEDCPARDLCRGCQPMPGFDVFCYRTDRVFNVYSRHFSHASFALLFHNFYALPTLKRHPKMHFFPDSLYTIPYWVSQMCFDSVFTSVLLCTYLMLNSHWWYFCIGAGIRKLT